MQSEVSVMPRRRRLPESPLCAFISRDSLMGSLSCESQCHPNLSVTSTVNTMPSINDLFLAHVASKPLPVSPPSPRHFYHENFLAQDHNRTCDTLMLKSETCPSPLIVPLDSVDTLLRRDPVVSHAPVNDVIDSQPSLACTPIGDSSECVDDSCAELVPSDVIQFFNESADLCANPTNADSFAPQSFLSSTKDTSEVYWLSDSLSEDSCSRLVDPNTDPSSNDFQVTSPLPTADQLILPAGRPPPIIHPKSSHSVETSSPLTPTEFIFEPVSSKVSSTPCTGGQIATVSFSGPHEKKPNGRRMDLGSTFLTSSVNPLPTEVGLNPSTDTREYSGAPVGSNTYPFLNVYFPPIMRKSSVELMKPATSTLNSVKNSTSVVERATPSCLCDSVNSERFILPTPSSLSSLPSALTSTNTSALTCLTPPQLRLISLNSKMVGTPQQPQLLYLNSGLNSLLLLPRPVVLTTATNTASLASPQIFLLRTAPSVVTTSTTLTQTKSDADGLLDDGLKQVCVGDTETILETSEPPIKVANLSLDEQKIPEKIAADTENLNGLPQQQQLRRRHQCPYCAKSCDRKDNLQAHIRTHTGERPYPCRFCHKAFPQKDHLRAHIRTHTGEKPYRCPQCMKAFAQLGNLHRHVKTHRR